MKSHIEVSKDTYPRFREAKTIQVDNGYLYLEYERLNNRSRELWLVCDACIREVLREELSKRQTEILNIIKVN